MPSIRLEKMNEVLSEVQSAQNVKPKSSRCCKWTSYFQLAGIITLIAMGSIIMVRLTYWWKIFIFSKHKLRQNSSEVYTQTVAPTKVVLTTPTVKPTSATINFVDRVLAIGRNTDQDLPRALVLSATDASPPVELTKTRIGKDVTISIRDNIILLRGEIYLYESWVTAFINFTISLSTVCKVPKSIKIKPMYTAIKTVNQIFLGNWSLNHSSVKLYLTETMCSCATHLQMSRSVTYPMICFSTSTPSTQRQNPSIPIVALYHLVKVRWIKTCYYTRSLVSFRLYIFAYPWRKLNLHAQYDRLYMGDGTGSTNQLTNFANCCRRKQGKLWTFQQTTSKRKVFKRWKFYTIGGESLVRPPYGTAKIKTIFLFDAITRLWSEVGQLTGTSLGLLRTLLYFSSSTNFYE